MGDGTIKNSDFYNNGPGIVPNALDSEQFLHPSTTASRGNRIFWSNFNHYAGAPFTIPASGPAGLPGYPVGSCLAQALPMPKPPAPPISQSARL